MTTKRDDSTKWIFYGLMLLLVCLLQLLVTDRILIYGVRPLLLPLAVAVVGVLEGPVFGGRFGLAAALLSLVAFYGIGLLPLLFFPIVGMLSGLMGEYIIQSQFLCSLVCSAACFAGIEGYHIIPRLLDGISIEPLLLRAVPELLYSLLCLIPVYFLFRSVFRRLQKRNRPLF